MGRAVGAEEEARVAGGRRREQRAAVALALQHGQAVVMRPQPAREDRVAVQEQVLGGDRRRDARGRLAHELRRLPRRDVLEHHAQRGVAVDDLREGLLEVDPLAVEDVAVGVRRLAVDEQGQARGSERLEHGPRAARSDTPSEECVVAPRG